MPYCTKEDIYDAMGEDTAKSYATDADTDEDADIEARIDAMIAKAGSRIDGYIGGRYALPLDPVPAILTDLAVDMAIYYVVTRKGMVEGSSEKAILEKYKDAVRFLERVADKKADIGVTSDTGAVTPPSRASYITPESPFDLDGFV
ncbi:MAG: DUF1320 domain-containing protein [Candidatus Latescibacterota bacterium]|jgi:phage gp36-like protein|nr:MAG: DUF1320 domain-containing protein [Candidatus Latescibacterota bacterium]